jgi:hypothetical protein
MSFRIIEITDTKPDGVVARVSHQNNQLTVIVPNKMKKDMPVGTSFEAEIGFDRIVGWKALDDFEDAKSGIWQDQDGTHLAGRIHNILDYGDGKTILDVYIRNGPEFFTLSLDALDDADLEGNDGLEITVGSLYIYPDER